MSVTVRLFAGLRERAGWSERSFDVPEGTCVVDVWALLDLGAQPRGLLYAVNHEYAVEDRVLASGDEVALIPPVSGGAFRLSEEPIDPAAVIARGVRPGRRRDRDVRRDDPGESRGRTVHYLDYEAYGGMAEKVMAELADELKAKHELCEVAIAHRIGRVDVGEISVVIAVSAPHRAAALAACKEAIDTLKTTVPLWKKEVYEGGEEWIGPGLLSDSGGYDGSMERLGHPGWCENLIGAGGLQAEERVLVVVDEPLPPEGAQLAAAVKDAGGEPRLELWAGERPLAAPPPGVLDGARTADLSFFIAQAPRGDEAAARFHLLQEVAAHGGRQIFMGFVDGELLAGELSQPFPDLAGRATTLIGALDGCETIRIRGRAGTDLTLRVGGRPWKTDATQLEPGEAANFPAARSSSLRTPTAPTACSSPT